MTTIKKTMKKPNLTFWQLWALSFGYIGIQLGYSLQGQMSGIYSSLGAVDKYLPLLWLGGPLAGILVQPIIGFASDRTWTKLGRRIPFLLAGGIIAAVVMVLIVNSQFIAGGWIPAVLVAAILFLLMDSAFNLSMQPMRALVGDMVNDEQRNKGFAIQMVLLNIGAIVGFVLPILLTSIIHALGWENTKIGGINISMSWSFYIGGAVLLLSVLWSTFRVKEYPPKEFAAYNGLTEETQKKESFWKILKTTPKVMLQLAAVQFFVWMGLFCMWNYGVNGVAQNIFGLERINGSIDTASAAFTDAQNWWGLSNAILSVCALLFSFVWANLANKFGRKTIYSAALIIGAIGLISIFFIHDKYVLFAAMAALGIATAVFNGIPFAIVSANVPPQKMGVYMGIFNLAIVFPQIVFAVLGGLIFNIVVGDTGNNVSMLVVSGISFLIAAACVWIVKDKQEVATPAINE
jgi:maltose/moltooligosaccharide transporter